MELLIIMALSGALFAGLSVAAAEKRDLSTTAAALLGFFLGLIGFIIVICYPMNAENNTRPLLEKSSADELKKFKELLDCGAISQAEYDVQKRKLLEN